MSTTSATPPFGKRIVKKILISILILLFLQPLITLWGNEGWTELGYFLRSIYATTLLSDANYSRNVNASYTVDGKIYTSRGYGKIAWRGSRIYLYDGYYDDKPAGVVRGAKGIVIWREPLNELPRLSLNIQPTKN